MNTELSPHPKPPPITRILICYGWIIQGNRHTINRRRQTAKTRGKNNLRARRQKRLTRMVTADIGTEIHRSKGKARHPLLRRNLTRIRKATRRFDQGNHRHIPDMLTERPNIACCLRLRKHHRRKRALRDMGHICGMPRRPSSIDPHNNGQIREISPQHCSGLVFILHPHGILKIKDNGIGPRGGGFGKPFRACRRHKKRRSNGLYHDANASIATAPPSGAVQSFSPPSASSA